jgi:hypothetical protein
VGGCRSALARIDETLRERDERGHVELDEPRVARPVHVVEAAAIAEAGVVDQDVDRATGRGRRPQRACGIGLSKISGDDVDLDTLTPWQVAATASSPSRRLAVNTSSTPSAASSRAMAAPMPLDAPVTNARLPLTPVVGALTSFS